MALAIDLYDLYDQYDYLPNFDINSILNTNNGPNQNSEQVLESAS